MREMQVIIHEGIQQVDRDLMAALFLDMRRLDFLL